MQSSCPQPHSLNNPLTSLHSKQLNCSSKQIIKRKEEMADRYMLSTAT
jgi:hypothetical protein